MVPEEIISQIRPVALRHYIEVNIITKLDTAGSVVLFEYQPVESDLMKSLVVYWLCVAVTLLTGVFDVVSLMVVGAGVCGCVYTDDDNPTA